MRKFSAAFDQVLSSGAATLCRCVKLSRTDGIVVGLTDHDASLTVDSVTYTPASGFEASEQSTALGPANGEWDLQAALTDDRLSTEDLLTGKFDGATIDLLLVDWSNPSAYITQSAGTLGEVSARDGVFHAEVRGPFAAFDQVRGRVFSATSDGYGSDDGTAPTVSATGTIASVLADNILTSTDAGAHVSGTFDGGLVRTSNGEWIRIRRHTASGSTSQFELWHAPATAPKAGDAIALARGAALTFEDHVARFGSGEDFRGFPYMPGDDFALSYPASSDGNLDGESL